MIVVEGKTKITVPDTLTITKKDEVFYNPKMEANRDISVCVIQTFLKNYKREEFLICDPLGGSGARGLRYANELEFKNGIVKVVINDINPKAVKLIKENIKLNNLDNVEVYEGDANVILSKNFRMFNVVDLDPFGSPSPYLDSGIRATITKNGLLCLTATDTAVLCGRFKKPCVRKYNAFPINSKDCHEMAIRILIGYAIRVAAKYDIGLKPIFSHATDHYVRTYLLTQRGAKKADEALEKLGYVKDIGGDKVIKSLYEGYEKGFGGPLYLGEIYDKEIVNEVYKIAVERNYSEKAKNILKVLCDECDINQLGCYDIHEICSNIKKSAPPMTTIIEKLKERGFKVSRVHYNPKGIKSDAKLSDIIEVILEATD
ncbi:tRNA (guanine(10)-N(2))-dimethyltransferase [Methanotorris igneus]|uniref:tRNA (guanine(26)-N(2))-dimethyltransferase n=1 Tax=Methanotorris igneus (strain DSM 5666 / JCM 11834 / Kol 5) TaxID=880724 RepID=F6BDG1_METIK|nr:tRNA (guanine(10)-N(2))-dimethyltransferase [Methanotorris igneus]AEF96522.1 N(2),N(2)-dimethylguanosine tRNA methyltransferase [Methanotorris igneus Kol 5]